MKIKMKMIVPITKKGFKKSTLNQKVWGINQLKEDVDKFCMVQDLLKKRKIKNQNSSVEDGEKDYVWQKHYG